MPVERLAIEIYFLDATRDPILRRCRDIVLLSCVALMHLLPQEHHTRQPA